MRRPALQESIEKQCDLRAILIGDKIFVTEMYPLLEETRVDFRAEYNALRYAPHDQLPEIVREALRSINRTISSGLLRNRPVVYTPDGRYVLLELNPGGQFGWLEARLGIPLYATLAALFTEHL
jgi:hypothetical protein